MGSVPILVTSGDNDPEIEPVQTRRHYHYCDACGSFDLRPWESTDRDLLERQRARLGAFALYASPLLFVPAWRATGSVLPLSMFALVVMGVGLQQVLKSWPFEALRSSGWLRASGRLALGAARWALLLALAEGLARVIPPGWVALAGGLLVATALARRAILSARHESLGLRCSKCSATYGYGTPFFADLDANPRGLTAADVPRPLYRLQHRDGPTIGSVPDKPQSRLPS